MNSLSLAHDDPALAAAAALPPPGALARLDGATGAAGLGVLDANGIDALPFLHNLLSNDVEHLDTSAARLGGLCSPKGRLLATLRYWRTRDGVRLLVSADLAEAIAKRLKMFVLRSKVTITNVSADTALAGLIAPSASALGPILAPWFGVLPDTVEGMVESDAGTLIRQADSCGLVRFLWCTPRAGFDSVLAQLGGALAPSTPEFWDWLTIRAGETRISTATQDRFVPQMINFELLGGVNFRKGCYPGQEVVARTAYRGTVKRRTLLASIADETAAVAAGVDVFDASAPQEPSGTIVNAARSPAGGFDCLVELRLAALDTGGTLHLGAPDGPVLTLRPLPYALPERDGEPAADDHGNGSI